MFCVGRLIAVFIYVGFEPFYYAINLDDVSFFMVFSEFDFLFI